MTEERGDESVLKWDSNTSLLCTDDTLLSHLRATVRSGPAGGERGEVFKALVRVGAEVGRNVSGPGLGSSDGQDVLGRGRSSHGVRNVKIVSSRIGVVSRVPSRHEDEKVVVLVHELVNIPVAVPVRVRVRPPARRVYPRPDVVPLVENISKVPRSIEPTSRLPDVVKRDLRE